MPSNTMNTATPRHGTHASQGARLVSTDGRDLPLRGAALRGRAGGGLARVTLEQVFSNPHKEPLRLTYQMPLPADGAVSAYAIRVGERTLRGVIENRQTAKERYEQALVEGRTAGILDQERSSLFTQKIGNVPAGTEVRVEIVIDQRLGWLDEGLWEWRFPTVAAPRYLGEEGRVPDAGQVTVDVSDRPVPVRASLELAIDDRLAEGRRPESPSHGITLGDEPEAAPPAARRDGGQPGGNEPAGNGNDAFGGAGPPADTACRAPGSSGASRAIVALTGEGASLDRDLVVRWAVAAPEAGVTLRRHRPAAGASHGEAAYGLLTLVPPAAPPRIFRRNLTVMIDTSGSMMGAPLEQARRIAGMLIDSLASEDTLELIAFNDRAIPWRRKPVRASANARKEAACWIRRLSASGGTEMSEAVKEALHPLDAAAQRQVVLITDGLVGFESRVVRSIRDGLPPGSRLHVVGVGPAVNRSLAAAAARAGRGHEVLAGLEEDAERCAGRIVAATRAPVVTDLTVEGSAVIGMAPRSCPDIFSGSPVLAGVKLRPEGGGLVVRGRTADGAWEQALAVEPTAPGEGPSTVAAFFAREAVEDLELDLASGESRREIEARIERIGLTFGIATRLTSWVAVSDRQDVDPREPGRVEIIPQELPHGLSALGLGLAPAGAPGEAALLADARLGMAWPPEMVPGEVGGKVRGGEAVESMSRGLISPDATEVGRRKREPEGFRHLLGSPGVTRPEDFPELRRGEIPARWTGRTAEGTWCLEFEVPAGGLHWDPHAPVILELEGRPAVECEIDPAGSTRPGRVEEKMVVRVAIILTEALKRNVRALYLHAGSETLRLAIRS